MRQGIAAWLSVVLAVVLAHAALAGASTVVLAVEGMT
jgi:hypothetical protein